MSKCVLPIFSPRNFMVLGLFRSLIHFEFIFVYGVRKCSNLILLHVAVQCTISFERSSSADSIFCVISESLSII